MLIILTIVAAILIVTATISYVTKDDYLFRFVFAITCILTFLSIFPCSALTERVEKINKIPYTESIENIFQYQVVDMPGLQQPLAEEWVYSIRSYWTFEKLPEKKIIRVIYIDKSRLRLDLGQEKSWNPRRIEGDLGPALRKGPIE